MASEDWRVPVSKASRESRNLFNWSIHPDTIHEAPHEADIHNDSRRSTSEKSEGSHEGVRHSSNSLTVPLSFAKRSKANQRKQRARSSTSPLPGKDAGAETYDSLSAESTPEQTEAGLPRSRSTATLSPPSLLEASTSNLSDISANASGFDAPGLGNSLDSATLSSLRFSESPRPSTKPKDLRARHWQYMFDNMQRAIDEIYCTCEAETNVIGCEQVVLALSNARDEFKLLVDRLEMQMVFENITDDQRPSSLAWEVLKSTPVRGSPRRTSGSTLEVGGLTMSGSKTYPSWADMVQRKPPLLKKPSQSSLDDDAESVLTNTQSSLSSLFLASREASLVDPLAASMSWADETDDHSETHTFNESTSSFRSQPSDILRQKLSSPTKKPAEETKRLLEARQVKALESRQRYQQEEAERLRRQHTRKVTEAQERRRNRERRYEQMIQDRLQKAERLRQQYLQDKRRKAAAEDQKIQEVAFIMQLDAESKKQEVLNKLEVQSARVTELQTDRKRKMQEEQSAREAVQSRRLEMEAARVARANELKTRREEKEAKIARQKQEESMKREQMAATKRAEAQRKREETAVALETGRESLKTKLQTKQELSEHRKEIVLEQRKEIAAALSRPSTAQSDSDHPQHLHSHSHAAAPGETSPSKHHAERHSSSAALSASVTASPVKTSAGSVTPKPLKPTNPYAKKAKKIRARLIKPVNLASPKSATTTQSAVTVPERATTTSSSAPPSPSAAVGAQESKVAPSKDTENLAASKQQTTPTTPFMPSQATVAPTTTAIASQEPGDSLASAVASLPPKLQKLVTEFNRAVQTPKSSQKAVLEKQIQEMQKFILATPDLPLRATTTVLDIMLSLLVSGEKSFVPSLSHQAIESIGSCLLMLIGEKMAHKHEHSRHIVTHAHYVTLLTVIQEVGKVKGSEEASNSFNDVLFSTLKTAFRDVLDSSADKKPTDSERISQQTLDDCISYLFISPTLDVFISELRGTNGAVFTGTSFYCVHQVLSGLLLILANCHVLGNDARSLVVTRLLDTDLLGIVSLMYGLLYEAGGTRRPTAQHVPTTTTDIVILGLKIVTQLLTIDSVTVQASLGSLTGLGNELKHLLGCIFNIFSRSPSRDLLNEAILLIGYLTYMNEHNQSFLMTGASMTLASYLCNLPFQYFSNKALMEVLFPTIISGCFRNPTLKAIIQQDMNFSLLTDFIQVKLALQTDASTSSSHTDIPERFRFETRFPRQYWAEALEFFSTTPTPSTASSTQPSTPSAN